MARVRTVEFLPEIFQTPAASQFLNATLDQLVQEPVFQKTQGFIGRRVGPGVNANDKYIVEPTKVRTDYQLEPGVIGLEPDTNNINEAITYPGINDTLAVQGAYTNNANRLYTSEYYTWDPFVDFDKFVNYQQYYWLPDGPQEVDVSATTVPLTDNFVVTRSNGVYTFSGQNGTNPALTLVRGGDYTFQVAQNAKEDVNYRVTNSSTSAYIIDYLPNPSLTLVRGNTYVFTLSLTGVHPFYIKTQASLGNTNTYNTGVTNNGSTVGTITFTVPQDAPDTLYYCSSIEFNMRGTLNIVDATSGTGPGFWIQTEPGVSGTLTSTPNISSRDVLGVTNNGEDLGTVTFNVPLATAQDFYYNLPNIGNVDLVTDMMYDQINGQLVSTFIADGGIDGITDLDGRSLIFQTQSSGWDSVPESQRYNIWRISYVAGYIQLTSVVTVNNLEKFNIIFGAQWASTQWYKTDLGVFQVIPLLTAIRDTLYYQDSTDPEIFGRIKLINLESVPVLNIADIIGKKNYISPNGVAFTNGLKVVFRGDVEPASYQNTAYYVEGVGTAIKLLPVTEFVTPEPYVDEEYVVLNSVSDSTLGGPVKPDYLTINRASPDLNPWSRSNRWFHIQVINYSATLNNTIPVLDNLYRGRRPILEFRAGTRLYNFGTQGKQAVNVIDFTNKDALSTINGTLGYGIDGYSFVEGSRVIFAADTDPDVRNKIYEVTFIVPEGVGDPIINLVPASDADILVNQSTVCLSGNTLRGQSFYYDGVDWIQAQEKIAVNQAPLFDVYDSSGISFGNRAKYISSTFVGSKLLSYATGSGVVDPVLGLVIKYLNLSNIGDIVFDNNLYTDTFIYVQNSQSTTTNISTGYVRQYSDRVNYVREIGWQTAVTPSLIRQQFQFTYDGTPIKLDIAVETNNVVPAVQIYIDGEFQSTDLYSVTTTAATTTITLNKTYVPGVIIEIDVLSNQVSSTAFYQVPINLENNPLNGNSSNFTLGTVRTHYGSIAENLLPLVGPVNGANNSRDLGNIVPYGLQILQQSSPLTLTGYFARNPDYDIFASIEYNSREYIKYKNLLLETVTRNEYNDMSVAEILDSAISYITQGRTNLNPFYWSDMLPGAPIYKQSVTTITPITSNVFDTSQTYNFTSSNFKGLLVYLTRGEETTMLIRSADGDVGEYAVSTDGPTLTITVPLQVGDIVTIREYADTSGNFCPNTPSKMGLYPKFHPRIYVSEDYLVPQTIIQGHDGSITMAFGDIRDEILLEFEKRIYNNIKTDGNPVPLSVVDVMPGAFRTTDYSLGEVNGILSESFLSWVGWNKVDYKTQNFIPDNPFTWNYSSSGSKLYQGEINNVTENLLLGAWRGIYRYYYDTTTPNSTPWEMIGFTEMPDWWEQRYGPAPYTSDNLVLWDDLELGLVADPVASYIRPQYARPGLTKVIPVSPEGELLSPSQSVMGQTDPTSYRKSWAVGDGGPVEYSWWTSSSYPYAIMRLLALTRPAEFFSLFADRDLYKYNEEFKQYLYNNRYRLDANGIEIYGSLNAGVTTNETIVGVSKSSYINWIVDYNQQLGKNSTKSLTDVLANLDVRLCYRMASFSNKQYLKIYTEKSSPNSQNTSLLLPDESYKLLLYKNQPSATITYSSVVVERVDTGYAVYGYSNTDPYFTIFISQTGGASQVITSGGATVRVPSSFTNLTTQVPYGYVFTNTTMVVDFLLSYGAYLTTQGLIFDDRFNGYQLDWNQMAKEFLYFSEQGWASGTLINLNPSANKLSAYRAGEVVDTIESITPENMLVDQNRTSIPTRDLVINREGNAFSATSVTGQSISYLKLKFTSFEHMIVFDNVSIFADLLYDPLTAARQDRVRVIGSVTADWNGVVDAQGFILNENNVKEWQGNRKYTKGEIVLYKNVYWSAQNIVQPKAIFDYNDWVKADYYLIQEGLLPNLANKADQLANSYNTYSANLERDNDLLSYGLIGFRPREYMTALNLSDVSQVNIYQQFLGTKGTSRAAEIFTRADLGKETGAYQIYENWAILAGTYGANANRSFFELRLNEAYLQSNPSTVQVIQPQQSSEADQTILLNNVWRESYKLTSTDILPTTYDRTFVTALPSAGYVNIDDVDYTVFSLDDPASIAENIDSIGIGKTIWVAKSNSYDWNIYRCEKVPGVITQITNNLNETAVVQFNAEHGLTVGDLIIIRYFANGVNGVYRVLSVPSIQQITIAFSFTNITQPTLFGTGICFYLQTARVSQASDVVNLPYSKQLLPGARVWVDNDGNGHWEVLEKQSPFTEFDQLISQPQITNSQFGSSIAPSKQNLSALVGAPGLNGDAGSVFSYRRDLNGNYAFNIQLELNAANVVGFGNAVAFGGDIWSVAGASASQNNTGYAVILYQVPASNDFIFAQLLLSPDQNFGPHKFGSAVTMSSDEQWLYIGSPKINNVYAYGRVDVQEQKVSYLTDGLTGTFNYSDYIQINSSFPGQLIVTLTNTATGLNVDYIYGEDYIINADEVILTTVPPRGLTVNIVRRISASLDSDTYYGVTQNASSGPGINATFTVNITRGAYYPVVTSGGTNYTPGDTLTIYGSAIGGTTPDNDLVITVTEIGSLGSIAGFTFTGSGDSTQVNFSLTPYLYTATNIYAFTVIVNGQLQRPHIDYEFNNDSSEATQDLSFITVPPPGAVIAVRAASYWQYVNTLTVPGLPAYAEFGTSISTTTDGRQVLIGAPFDDTGLTTRSGNVYAFDRSVIASVITDATETVYPIPGSYTDPISVKLNGIFLTDTSQYVNGQYSVTSGNIVFTEFANPVIGDILEIETNQFNLIQQIVDNNSVEEGAFGTSLKICNTNCSVYTGAPLTTTVYPQDGKVQRNINQSRAYGVITSLIANPTLYEGDSIRVNDILVYVSGAPNNTVAGLVDNINSAGIPNVVASTTENLLIPGDGTIKIFGVGSIYSSAESYTPLVYINEVEQVNGVDYTYNNAKQQVIFVTAPAFGTIITVVSGKLTLNVINPAAAVVGDNLTVLPGIDGTRLFDSLGFETYVYTQTITSPNPSDYAYFGQSIDVDTSAITLVVGAPNGNIYRAVTFDGGSTYFDDRSTTFFTPINNSGVAYTFDYLPSANGSITNPGMFVFGQQVYTSNIRRNDQYGLGVGYRNGRLLVGAPGYDVAVEDLNYGLVTVYSNPNNLPSWAVIHAQQPVVKVDQLNSVFVYNRLTSTTQTYFDFFDPLQGKILGVARRNIDYVGAVDPASYNQGSIHNLGNSWAEEHVGEIWWDTDTVRFIDPNQDNITYASRRWGQVFPGSRIDIYQWVASTVPPVSYTGPGTPLSTVSYTTTSDLNQYNIFETTYYFWVRGITTVATAAGKTLSTTGIASYIENPRGSGIPYIAPINASTIAIYNALDLISAADTIIHIEYDRQLTSANIHQEFQLIVDGQADSFLNDTLYLKMLDSFCGTTVDGANVPDPMLSPAERYGVQFRPRQSMFADRFAALKNYLERANTVFKTYPIVESRRLTLLNSSDPEPSANSGAWNKRVANLEELSFQNLYIVPIGYKYLVVADSSESGLWTIYEVANGTLVGERVLNLVQVQTYDTRKYWYTIDWYKPGYNSTITPVTEVPTYSALDSLTYTQVPVGSSVKVTANAQGKFEIYLRTDLGWDRVGLQNGTIQISEVIWNYAAGNFGFDVEVFDAQYFDQEPTTETRKIIRAINEELFIDELAIERNISLILMFNFIYSEFVAPEWLIKTSLVDVDHKIRALLPFQNYLKDNQEFVLDYINEVKPYHVQIRAFNLTYYGDDTYPGMITDYDVPAYYDSALSVPQYVSPILLPYDQSQSAIQSSLSNRAADAEVWTTNPWDQWFNNYLLSIQDVTMINVGAGYTEPPTVTVIGDCVEQATMTAVIDSLGRVVAVIVDNPGFGYRTTATITITGGSGTGATAVAVMGNNLVRSIRTTIKYDRYQYTSSIQDWQADVTYQAGDRVRYNNKVYSADETVTSSTFDFEQWTFVPAENLTGVDRTMGYYVPTVNQPGLSLPLLIDGIEYPGVQVTGPSYSQNTGFDVGNYDINPFDNINYDLNGQPTYDLGILDAMYGSSYLDIYLGTRPTDVNVVGGAYVDPYSSHAPEELIPGAIFDTLDMRVYTRPGSDWSSDSTIPLGWTREGHGFPLADVRYEFNAGEPTLSWAGLLPNVNAITVSNATSNFVLGLDVDYTIDWIDQTVTIIGAVTNGQILVINAYGIGGGNQLYENTWNGQDIGNQVIIPVQYSLIQNLVVFVNGEVTTDYTYSNYVDGVNQTQIDFGITYTDTDAVTIAAIGPTTTITETIVNYNWSTPITQFFTGDGYTQVFDLDNSLEYNNPVNPIVMINGVRVRTAASAGYISDGYTNYYEVPTRIGVNPTVVLDADITVYIDGIEQVVGVDYNILAVYPRVIEFIGFGYFGPTLGSRITVAVTTAAKAVIIGSQLIFDPSATPPNESVISIITWNDTRQQDLLTEVFVGPVANETVDGTVYVNDLQLSRVITNPDRLWVTLNGTRLFYGIDFTVDVTSVYAVGSELILSSGVMDSLDVVMVTLFTESVVPGPIAFRIFQDMRGVQASYRITANTTTTVAQPVSQNADVIYVADASVLPKPDVTINVWGVVTIDGERIMYRSRDTTNNTISSLLRGTGGTAASTHTVGAYVYDMSRDNLLPIEYQDYYDESFFTGDGSTYGFTSTNITYNSTLVEINDSTLKNATEVFVGGTLQISGYELGVNWFDTLPYGAGEYDNEFMLTVTLDVAPGDGVEVCLRVRKGYTWYGNTGEGGDGVALQETNTLAARFIRGLI